MSLHFELETAQAVQRMKRWRTIRYAVCCICLLSVAGVCAAQTGLDEEFDDQSKSWKEIELKLPAAPRPENLIRFWVSPTATQSFMLDAASLTIGADGVIRYTMVATSAAGAKNISYEAIRCKSYEKKVYAFGRADGSWSRSTRDQWEAIKSSAANRQHASLAQDFFCDGETIAGNAAEILEKMRNRQPRS